MFLKFKWNVKMLTIIIVVLLYNTSGLTAKDLENEIILKHLTNYLNNGTVPTNQRLHSISEIEDSSMPNDTSVLMDSTETETETETESSEFNSEKSNADLQTYHENRREKRSADPNPVEVTTTIASTVDPPNSTDYVIPDDYNYSESDYSEYDYNYEYNYLNYYPENSEEDVQPRKLDPSFLMPKKITKFGRNFMIKTPRQLKIKSIQKRAAHTNDFSYTEQPYKMKPDFNFDSNKNKYITSSLNKNKYVTQISSRLSSDGGSVIANTPTPTLNPLQSFRMKATSIAPLVFRKTVFSNDGFKNIYTETTPYPVKWKKSKYNSENNFIYTYDDEDKACEEEIQRMPSPIFSAPHVQNKFETTTMINILPRTTRSVSALTAPMYYFVSMFEKPNHMTDSQCRRLLKQCKCRNSDKYKVKCMEKLKEHTCFAAPKIKKVKTVRHKMPFYPLYMWAGGL